jgi:hypothetical protein
MKRIANATTATGEEIEVTTAMIEAGVDELALCESGDSWWSTAEAVYRAMEKVRRETVAANRLLRGTIPCSRDPVTRMRTINMNSCRNASLTSWADFPG